MLGFILFLWISFCLAPSLATSDQGKDVESCFLYTVSENTSSPLYDVSGKGEHFVTVNHIFSETNVVRFLDEQGSCVVALAQNTSEQQKHCSQTLPSDGEYTTLVYRRQDDGLTAYKKNSLEYAVSLSTDIRKLRITSNKMVNIAFDCPGSCYTFRKATIHWTGLKERPGSSFLVYGRVKASSENWNPSADVIRVNGGERHLSFDSLIPEGTRHDWFSLKFHVTLGEFYKPFHTVDLLVTNPRKKGETPVSVRETLSIPTKDLYLSFARSENVLWAVTCDPGKDVTLALSCKQNSNTTVALSCLPEYPSAPLRRESDCHTFEKATIHFNYTQVNSKSPFKIFGRKKPSPDEEHLLAAEVMVGEHMNISKTVAINNLDLEVVSNKWFQLDFHVSFGNLSNGSKYNFYPMELIVKNPLNGKQDECNRTVSTKDLYLNFSQSDNVVWAIPCIPGSETLTQNLENGSALQRQSDVALITLGCMCAVLALISIAVTLYLWHLCRHQAFSSAASTVAVLLPPPPPLPADAAAVPTPPHSVGDSSVGGTVETDRTSLVEHHYEYIDLSVLREQMAEEKSNSRGNLVEQQRSSKLRKSHTSINSVYGLARANETVDESSDGNETVNHANAL